MQHSRIRGILAARADNGVASVIANLNGAFEAFKADHRAQVSELERMVEAQQTSIDALRVGSGGGSGIHPGAGIRDGKRRTRPIDAEIAATFRAQMQGRPHAGMTTQSDPDGGYTVAPEVDGVIDAVLRDISPMRTLARVVQIPAGKGHWEKILGRTGSQSAWAGEEDDREDTESPIFGKVEIYPEELYAIPMLTNHVIEDSAFDLNAFLEEDVSGEFALTEGLAFIEGNGIKKPRGFLTYDATDEADADRAFGKLQYVATGASGDWPGCEADALFDLVTALRPIYRAGDGVGWLMNSTTANAVRKFKDGSGRYMWTDSIVEGQPDRLAGYPVAIDEGMPDIDTDTVPVAFGNWRRGYAVVDKPELRLIVDRVTKKGWTKLYFSRRVGGGVVDSNAIKLLKFSST